jgi:hypothetical protein
MWPSVASRKHTYWKDKEGAWKLFFREAAFINLRGIRAFKAKNGGLALINVDLKAKVLFIKKLQTMPNHYIYANSARLSLG